MDIALVLTYSRANRHSGATVLLIVFLSVRTVLVATIFLAILGGKAAPIC
jgi:hypothetical protein